MDFRIHITWIFIWAWIDRIHVLNGLPLKTLVECRAEYSHHCLSAELPKYPSKLCPHALSIHRPASQKYAPWNKVQVCCVDVEGDNCMWWFSRICLCMHMVKPSQETLYAHSLMLTGIILLLCMYKITLLHVLGAITYSYRLYIILLYMYIFICIFFLKLLFLISALLKVLYISCWHNIRAHPFNMFYLRRLGFILIRVYFFYALCTSAGVYLDVPAVSNCNWRCVS